MNRKASLHRASDWGEETYMLEWAEQAEGIWQYAALFLLAAAPWLDVFIVVPAGIVWGLQPVAVAIVGFAGNFLMIVLLGLLFNTYRNWRDKRRAAKGVAAENKRETRARNLWERYGLPGLALLAPVLVGTDLAALMALTFGSSRTRVIGWMGVSLAVWTVVMTVSSVYGFSYINWI